VTSSQRLAELLAVRAVRGQSLYYRAAGRWRTRRDTPTRAGGQSDFYRTAWREAATAVGATITQPDDYYAEIRCRETVLRVRNHITSLDDALTQAIAADKPVVNRLLKDHGLPVPRSRVVRSDDVAAAWDFVASLSRACVVKPARGTGGGTGITTGVTTRGALIPALARAGLHAREVIVEEQLHGDTYRLLYLDGELLDALERRPPTLRGDGRSSIRQLIEEEHRLLRERGVGLARSPFAIDDELKRTLRAAGLRLSSVPLEGELVTLRTVVSQNGRQYGATANDRLCPALVEAGARAAAVLGIRLAGVDLITADPALPLEDVGGAIIEVNTTPGLHYHYSVTGEPTPVVLLILQRLCGQAT
jgi:D-alanine-D-alanine ligase-like ATP-grasp enzyme